MKETWQGGIRDADGNVIKYRYGPGLEQKDEKGTVFGKKIKIIGFIWYDSYGMNHTRNESRLIYV